MIEKQLYRDPGIASFFLECLVWKVPTPIFAQSTYSATARAVALQIRSDMREPAKANDYAETSDLLWLLRGQKRQPSEAKEFTLKVWNYLEP